ncbi:MAG: peptidyl-prolyl cis-trans isomerase [Acidobacteria bacterium]|nr:peptidyl-prolyl cis-trans isomerase [Acidobacteriota bacterium]
MLKFFKRMERTRNFVLLLFSILMVASLILFYAPTPNNVQGDLARDETTAAEVGGENITVANLAMQQENMNRLGRPLPAKFFLDGMIRERIIRGEAKKLGLAATDAEVASYIRQQNKPEEGDLPFDQARYEQNVTEQFGSVSNFEQSVRDQLSGKKIQAFLTSGVTVSEEEVLNDYKRKNIKFDLTYVPVSSADLAQTIKPTDEELKNYFEQNKQNYYFNVPQKKIRYIFLNTSKIGEKLQISEEDLKAEYEKIPDDKKQAGVQGQQIVLRVSKPELEPQVVAKANELVAQARKENGKISEEAFAELAKGQSEDAATAANGGKLSGLVKANPSKPDDPYQRLLTMQPGEVSEPIKYQDRYFILRRGEAVPKTYEDAKKEIEVSLRNRRAYTAAAELAQKVDDRLKEVKDVQKVAEEFAAQANVSPKDMVRETGYVKPGDDVPNIGNSPQFEEGIASLVNQGDVGDKIPIQNGFAIPMLVDKKEPRNAEFDEVKEQIAETVKIEQARARVEEIAKQIAADASSASALAAASQAKGLKAQEANSFLLGSPLGEGPSAATSEALEDTIYGLKPGEVTKEPIRIGENLYIVAVKSREEASMEDFAKQRDQLIEAKLTEKRGQVFQDYLASRRQEMEANGEIKIYQDALAKLEEVPKTQEQ